MPDAGAGLRAPARTAVLLRERPGPRLMLFACPAGVARMSASISGLLFNSRMSLCSCGLRAANAAGDLPDVIRLSSPVLKNIPSSRLTQITGLSPPSCSGRGALAIVTNVGMGCGGRNSISARVGVRTSGAVAYGKAVWSRRPDAGVQVPEKQASRGRWWQESPVTRESAV